MLVSGSHRISVTDSITLPSTKYSGDSPVMPGVTQGSVLGAFLSWFVNSSLAYLRRVITVLFADDTTLLVASHSVEDISTTVTSALTSASDHE